MHDYNQCPYANNPSLHNLPCHWMNHPHKPNIRLCDVCQRHYDVRNVGNPRHEQPQWMVLLVLGIFALLLVIG
jgi:hypothetical protein